MENLRTKVQQMLNGERKRREIALKFAEQVSEILEPVAPDIWGHGAPGDPGDTVWVTKKDEKTGKLKTTNIYFRYSEWKGLNATEYPGFYLENKDGRGLMVRGTPIEELRGKQFWYVIQSVLEWIPIVAEAIEKREHSRNQLLSLLSRPDREAETRE